jgi:hypothetical protein
MSPFTRRFSGKQKKLLLRSAPNKALDFTQCVIELSQFHKTLRQSDRQRDCRDVLPLTV